MLAEPKTLIELDFRSVTEAVSLENLTASWKMKNVKKANAIVTFNRSTFIDKIEMDAFASQSWGVGINEFVRFDVKSGELYFRTTWTRNRAIGRSEFHPIPRSGRRILARCSRSQGLG
jgi:hypothetical protein